MSEPIVSIAMPVFNGGPDLRLAVASILAQSFEDWELIIIDDGSTDGSVDTLLRLNDPRVIIVQDGQNHGLGARLNEAIARARGTYIARMDHDDISHPERLEKQVAFLEKTPNVDLLATQCMTISPDNSPIGYLPHVTEHADIVRHPWKGFYMPHPSWMGRAAWFRKYAYADPAPYRCEDQELLLRAHKSSVYHALPESLLAYRVRLHTPWDQISKTRISWAKVQSTYFVAQGQWRAAILATVSCAMRIGFDLIKSITGQSAATKKSDLSPDQMRFWKSYIGALRLSPKDDM